MKGGYKPYKISLKISDPNPTMNIVSNLPLSLPLTSPASPISVLHSSSAFADPDYHSVVYTPTRINLDSETEITTLSPVFVPQSPTTVKVEESVLYRKKITRYFFEKLKIWLNSDYENLLDFLKVKGKKVSIVNSMREFRKNTTKGKDYKIKIKYILENIMTVYDLKSFLKKFVVKTDFKWFELKENKKLVKKTLYKRIKKNFTNLID